MSKKLLTCYNRGCGQDFDPDENNEKSCVYHPGEPFFHDAYKGWSCCKRKTVDFTEFLNMKGCFTSFHSNVKPPQPEKPEVKEEVEVKTISQPIAKPMERPSIHNETISLRVELSASIKAQILTDKPKNGIEEETPEPKEIAIGTECKNAGCSVKYEGKISDEGICHFHSGVPIFHEGLKYWSCCKKRTSDFQAFLDQKGCVDGTHVWHKKKDKFVDGEGKPMMSARFDWHQTAQNVIMAIYAKKYDPNEAVVKANGVKLEVRIYFPEEDGWFRQSWILAGVVNPSESFVLMTPTKLEITLRKAEPVTWTNLDIPQTLHEALEKKEEVKTVGVEALDLNDL